eukprot:7614937-Lingulodinium_polyedra.AAC.1
MRSGGTCGAKANGGERGYSHVGDVQNPKTCDCRDRIFLELERKPHAQGQRFDAHTNREATT